jgi:SAM-dependent methyltransferase
MLEQARARGVRGAGWKTASADDLPFRDGWFDAAVMRLMVHTLGGARSASLREARRVLGETGGRLFVWTFDPEHITGFHLAPYLPGLVAIDLARFPDPQVLTDELRGAGFASVRTRALQQSRLVPRAFAAERLRAGYISTVHLLDPAEVAAAAERLEREAADGLPPLESSLRWRLLVAER